MTIRQALLLAAVFLVGLYLLSGKTPSPTPQPIAPDLPEQVDTQGAVIVSVKPLAQTSDSYWKFQIGLETHSVELDYDLTQNSFLVDSKGREYQAKSWEGDPPGGHHRQGILTFASLVSGSQEIKLVIKDIDSVPERIFSWGQDKITRD